MTTSTIIAIIVALAAPLAAYLAAVRRFSGKIGSSDAAELWAESRSIRDWSQIRITQLNELVSRLEKKIDECVITNEELREKNQELRETIVSLESDIATLKVQVNGSE